MTTVVYFSFCSLSWYYFNIMLINEILINWWRKFNDKKIFLHNLSWSANFRQIITDFMIIFCCPRFYLSKSSTSSICLIVPSTTPQDPAIPESVNQSLPTSWASPMAVRSMCWRFGGRVRSWVAVNWLMSMLMYSEWND